MSGSSLLQAPLQALLQVRGLCITDNSTGAELVRGLSFDLHAGQCLGMVGESGSGKTLACRALLGLVPPTLRVTGSISYRGRELVGADAEYLRKVRGGGLTMIVQQPMTAFDPLYRMGAQMAETLLAHDICPTGEVADYSRRLLERVRVAEPEQVLLRYPHQLSGGTLQRCMIALALALRPEIMVADEPTTALDAENQYEVVQEFLRIRREWGVSMLFVSHDLGVVQCLADQVVVMQQGACVEHGPAERVFNAPQHACTRHLVQTRLALTRRFEELVGTEISMQNNSAKLAHTRGCL